MMMSESWLKLTNQVCVVTGATGGMGEKKFVLNLLNRVRWLF